MSRPLRVGDCDDDYVLKTEFFGWLSVGGRRIGAFELNLYDPCGCGSNGQFLEIMDCDEEYESRLATVLCAAWRDVIIDVASSGPILDFRSAWLHPLFAKGGMFAAVANSIIDDLFAEHSILIMKAFPLEYEGEVPKGSQLAQGLARRRRSMERYYGHVFGVAPLPGWGGQDGWLWCANKIYRELIAPPRTMRKPKSGSPL